MRRLALVLLATLAAAPAAHAGTFKPPPGKVYTGVSGGVSTQPYSGEVGKDIAVMGASCSGTAATTTRSAPPTPPAPG